MFNPIVTPFDPVSNAQRARRSFAELGDVPIQQLTVPDDAEAPVVAAYQDCSREVALPTLPGAQS